MPLDVESHRRIAAALAACREEQSAPRAAIKDAVLTALRAFAAATPGRSVEVRVPPFGAIQAVPGSVHRRGTPPALVETDAATWLALVLGEVGWSDAVADGRVRASGARSDLAPYLPLG